MARVCTAEETIDALRIIKAKCEENIECAMCPFGTTDGKCLVTSVDPCDWNIVENKALIKFLY